MRQYVYLIFLFLLFSGASGDVKAQSENETRTITLYSPINHQHDQSRAFFDFQKGALAPHGGHWDLGYGLLYVEDDWNEN